MSSLTLCILFCLLFVVDVVDGQVDFKGGALTSSKVAAFSRSINGGPYESSLLWLSKNAEFFPVNGTNGVVLQGYKVLHKEPKETDTTLVFCAGWSETTLKYGHLLQDLHKAGYNIWSFDMRGQGFSQNTHWNKGRVTHMVSIDEYVSDLRMFVNDHVKNDHTKEVVYVANSMAGLVGLTTQVKHPDTFAKMILSAPAVEASDVPPPVRILLGALLRLPGVAKLLPVRLPLDISKLRLSHDTEMFEGWQRLRALCPEQLWVHGPSASFLYELALAGKRIRKNAHKILIDVLVLQASDDIFVSNKAISTFVGNLGSGTARLVKFADTYHELYAESSTVLEKIKHEMFAFLGRGNARVFGVMMHFKGGGSGSLDPNALLARAAAGVEVIDTEPEALSTTNTTSESDKRSTG